jgi:hypothetical protein
VTVMVVFRLWRCVWILQETIALVARKPKSGTIKDHTDE